MESDAPATSMKNRPSTTTCGNAAPSRLTNCGRKAPRKISALGFDQITTKPSSISRR